MYDYQVVLCLSHDNRLTNAYTLVSASRSNPVKDKNFSLALSLCLETTCAFPAVSNKLLEVATTLAAKNLKNYKKNANDLDLLNELTGVRVKIIL